MYQMVKFYHLQIYPIEKPKFPIKYLLEMLNTQLTFAILKWNKKECVTYPIVQIIN